MDEKLKTAREFLGLFGRGQFEKAGALMHPRAVVLLPNTREAFQGRDNYIGFNKRYPGKWRFKIERLEACGRGAAAAARVFSPQSKKSFHVASFFEFKSGLITRITEYWGQDGEPPVWRKRGGWAKRY